MNFGPVIYPVPKEMSCGKILPLPSCPVCIIKYAPGLEKAADVARDMLQKLIPGISFADSDGDIALELSKDFSHQQPEAYQLHSKSGKVAICGASYNGVICGLATFRLLMIDKGKFSGSLYECSITDYPDVRWRAASRWLIGLEGHRMAYDWGDGKEEMLRRYREKIDFAMHYKINIAFFDGFTWNLNKYPGYASDIRELNNYAAARNVSLEFGGHYIGIGGRNPEFKDAASCGFMAGLGDLNRHSYPDGEPYRCMGKSEDHPTRFNGTCRSNEALNQLKMKQLANYVRQLEPRMLYIHPEDAGRISVLENDWLLRCPECRKRWPSDIPEAKDGAAGAQAWNLSKLWEAISSVKNEDTGYDGAKDCLCVIVPISYAGGQIDDEEFERDVIQYKNISEMMPDSPNVMLLMREQFIRCANGKLRTAHLCDESALNTAVFAVNGADGYAGGSLFVPGGLMYSFFRGAELIFSFAGTIYQEVQEVFNSECSWNIPDLPDEIMDKLNENSLTDGAYKYLHKVIPGYEENINGEKGFLTRFCRNFYGDEAGDAVADIIRMMTWGEYSRGDYPMVSASYHFDKEHLFDNTKADISLKVDHGLLLQHWITTAERTKLALDRLGSSAGTIADPFIREVMTRFTKVLQLNVRISAIIRDILKGEKASFASIRQQINEARQYLAANFKTAFIAPNEGENELWPKYLDRLENKLNDMEKE